MAVADYPSQKNQTTDDPQLGQMTGQYSPEEQHSPNEIEQPTKLVVREIIETLLLTFFIFWLGNSSSPTLPEGEGGGSKLAAHRQPVRGS